MTVNFFRRQIINVWEKVKNASCNVTYHHFGRDHHFMQWTQQFDLIDATNGGANHHVIEKCE